MNIPNQKTLSMVLILLASLISTQTSYANTDDSTDSTSIAAELKSAIEQGGAAAAKARFAEIYPAQQAKFHFDSQDFLAIITEYANAGDMETVQVLGEINATLTQAMIQTQMAAAQPEILEMMKQQQQAMAEAEQQQQAAEQIEQQNQAQIQRRSKGQLRSDLDRFTGLYGDTPHRQLWVSKTCEGQLVVGATWGDAAPWWMRSAADAVFTYSDQFFSLAVEFKLNDKNQAIELSHDLENVANPMVRTGPLTADYQACIEPHRR